MLAQHATAASLFATIAGLTVFQATRADQGPQPQVGSFDRQAADVGQTRPGDLQVTCTVSLFWRQDILAKVLVETTPV